LATAARHAQRLVVDVIAPLALEVAEVGGATRKRDDVVRWRARELDDHLAVADLVLCTNDKQRDLLVGAALAAGLLETERPLGARIAVVPHGLDDVGRASRDSPLRDATGLAAHDRIAVWGGGMWSWLDPLTAIRAVELVAAQRPEVKLAFIGHAPPDPAQRRAHRAVAGEAAAYVRDRGLEKTVVFGPGWLPRDAFVAHLAGADVGVSLHARALEGRYASRTRVVDYLEAGLRVLCSSGDTMSELVAVGGLGEVVEPLDVAGCARALDRLTRHAGGSADAVVAPEALRWPNVAVPLVEFCAALPPASRAGRAAALVRAARSYPAFARAVRSDAGAPGLARAAAGRVGASLRRPG
jgi:glycosyltransferase involved in cell wall biosynthesis